MCWISFIEEFWKGQREGTAMGRIEVYRDNPHRYADEEIRFATDRVEEFEVFREHWDWMDITEYHLTWLRSYTAKKFCVAQTGKHNEKDNRRKDERPNTREADSKAG